jgi:hypothetical protein
MPMDTREKLEYIVANKDKIPESLYQNVTEESWNYEKERSNNDAVKAVLLMDNYHSGNYEGSGERVLITKDGKLWYGFTSHCSCYGPWENKDFDKLYENDFKGLSRNQTHDYTKDSNLEIKEEYKQFEMEVITLIDAFGEDLKNGVDLVYDCLKGNISVETCITRIYKQDNKY